MTTRPIRIGYYDPFNVYQLVQKELESRFPLTNMHWKFKLLKPVKSIPVLPVELVEEIPKSSATTDKSVYLRLIFVTCDSLDSYRLQVRPLIKEWLKKLVVNFSVEWVIVFVIPSGSKDKLSTIIKTSLYDKLKLDFDVNGKELQLLSIELGIERCLKLRETYENEYAKTESYAELVSQLKAMLLNTFDMKHQIYDDKLTANDNNLSESLMAKLQLAKLYFHMGLLEDSLALYDELYAEADSFLEQTTKKVTDTFEYSVALKDLNYYTLGVNDTANFDPEKLLLSSTINIFSFKGLIFSCQAQILHSLATSSSPSSSLGHVGVLFRRLTLFLNEMSNRTSISVSEWVFSVIDHYLELDAYSVAQTYIESAADDDMKLQSTNFYNSRAELLLLQRNVLIKIGYTFGYTIKGLQDVLNDFDEVSLDKNSTPSARKTELSNPRLVATLKDKDSFFEYFENMTEFIIQDLVACGRQKTVDMLSIDLALLYYHRKNYEAAIDIIQNSSLYFIESGWSFLGGMLLEIYLYCIQTVKPDNYLTRLDICFKLIASIPSNTFNGKVVGINSYQLIKKSAQVVALFKEMVKCSDMIMESTQYNLNDFFYFEISPFIDADLDSPLDRYYIEVKITNLLSIPLPLKSIMVTFLSPTDKVEFLRNDVNLTKDREQVIRVYSRFFTRGYLSLKSIIVQLSDNLLLCHNLESEIDEDVDNNTVLKFTYGSLVQNETMHQPSCISSPEQFLMYRSLKKLWCEFHQPELISLGSNAVDLIIHGGNTDISGLKVTISSDSPGVTFNDGSEIYDKKVDKLSSGEAKIARVEYLYTGDSLKVNMTARLAYSVNGEDFAFSIFEEIDRTLAVSVTVLDIFRENYFYSKFQVGTSNAKLPLRIHKVNLLGEKDSFDIEVPKNDPGLIVAFGEQPISFLYKIFPKESFFANKKEDFNLTVTYADIRSECLLSLQDKLICQLRKQGLDRYWFLFFSLLRDSLKVDINHYAIYREIRLLNHIEVMMLITKVLKIHVADKDHQDLLILLIGDILSEEWVEMREQLGHLNNLAITVPAPNLDVLHSAEFEYEHKCQYLVGEPLELKLKINTTVQWAQVKSGLEGDEILASSSPKRAQVANRKDNFQALILNDENWLISGFKRETFEVEYSSASSENSLSVVLVPLNVGKLELPKISIKAASSKDKDISMDTVLKNGSETLLVVPEVNSITFTF